MAAFCRARGARATIVFDGHPLRADMAAQELGPVSLRVPAAGQDADTVIRELVERAPRPADLIVVTSDKALYSYVKTRARRCCARTSGTRSSASSSPRGAADGAARSRTAKTDVEGWLKRFGGAEIALRPLSRRFAIVRTPAPPSAVR